MQEETAKAPVCERKCQRLAAVLEKGDSVDPRRGYVIREVIGGRSILRSPVSRVLRACTLRRGVARAAACHCCQGLAPGISQAELGCARTVVHRRLQRIVVGRALVVLIVDRAVSQVRTSVGGGRYSGIETRVEVIRGRRGLAAGQTAGYAGRTYLQRPVDIVAAADPRSQMTCLAACIRNDSNHVALELMFQRQAVRLDLRGREGKRDAIQVLRCGGYGRASCRSIAEQTVQDIRALVVRRVLPVSIVNHRDGDPRIADSISSAE